MLSMLITGIFKFFSLPSIIFELSVLFFDSVFVVRMAEMPGDLCL